MKQYVVDELRPGDHDALKKFLDENLGASGIDGVYWRPVEDALLTPEQASHTQCAPFFLAFTLTPDSLACEFLVRTKNRIRCDCIAYATTEQRDWIIQWVDDVLDRLGIIT